MSWDEFWAEWRGGWSHWAAGFLAGFGAAMPVFAVVFTLMSLFHRDYPILLGCAGLLLAVGCYWWGKRSR